MKIVCGIPLIIFCFSLRAQSNLGLDSLVAHFVNTGWEMPIEFYNRDSSEHLLHLGSHYINSKDPKKRFEAYGIIDFIAEYRSGESVSDKAYQLLATALVDQDQKIRWYYSGELTEYSAKAANDKVKTLVSQALHDPNLINEHTILLAGKLKITDEPPHLSDIEKRNSRNTKDSPVYFRSLHWATQLQKSRSGDQKSTEYVIQRIKQEPEISIILYRLDDLAYTQQRAAIDLIVEFLLSDKKLPSIDGGYKEPYSNKAAIQLATVIQGFPLEETRMGFYRVKEIEEARKWMGEKRNNYKLKN